MIGPPRGAVNAATLIAGISKAYGSRRRAAGAGRRLDQAFGTP